jgi:hypothetical protein
LQSGTVKRLPRASFSCCVLDAKSVIPGSAQHGFFEAATPNDTKSVFWLRLLLFAARGRKERVLMAELVDTSLFGHRFDVSRNFEEPPLFTTDHLYLTGFLVCTGHSIVNTSRNGARVSFEFNKTPQLLADVAHFMSGALVPARQFSFELLKIKRMLYGGK